MGLKVRIHEYPFWLGMTANLTEICDTLLFSRVQLGTGRLCLCRPLLSALVEKEVSSWGSSVVGKDRGALAQVGEGAGAWTVAVVTAGEEADCRG